MFSDERVSWLADTNISWHSNGLFRYITSVAFVECVRCPLLHAAFFRTLCTQIIKCFVQKDVIWDTCIDCSKNLHQDLQRCL